MITLWVHFIRIFWVLCSDRLQEKLDLLAVDWSYGGLGSLLSFVWMLSHLILRTVLCTSWAKTIPILQLKSQVPKDEGLGLLRSGVSRKYQLWDSRPDISNPSHLPVCRHQMNVAVGSLVQLCFSLPQGHDHVSGRLWAALESSHWEKCLLGERAWWEGESPRICSATEGWSQRSGGLGFVPSALTSTVPSLSLRALPGVTFAGNLRLAWHTGCLVRGCGTTLKFQLIVYNI